MSDGDRFTGMHALYRVTPFSLLEMEPYKMVLPPVSYMSAQEVNLHSQGTYRSNSTLDKFSVPIQEGDFDKEIVQPHQLFAREFPQGSSESITYQFRNIRDESRWVTPPAHMEFSYEALENTRHCQLGWVVSSSEDMCPVRESCPDRESPDQRGGCKYYEQSGKFSRLYNVYPDIEAHFSDSPLEAMERVGTIRYRDRPLLGIGYTDDGDFQAYINRITFNSKVPWIYRTPSVFTSEGLGFRTQNVNALEVEVHDQVFQDFITDLLMENDRLRNWIALKYVCYDGGDLDTLDDKQGFDAYDTLEETIARSIDTSSQDSEDSSGSESNTEGSLIEDVLAVDFEVDEHARGFAEAVFLHSFSHLLRDRLCVEYGADSDQIGYYIEHPRIASKTTQSRKTRIVLYESAIGGFGYLEEFRDTILRDGVVLDELFDPVIDYLQDHAETTEQEYTEVLQKLECRETDRSRETKAAFQALDELGIYPPYRAIRRVIDDRHDISNESGTERADFTRIGSLAPQCWDGCGVCVEDDDDCSYLPFDRPFLLSRSLSLNALETIAENAATPTTRSEGELTETVQDFIASARSELAIRTRGLSPELARLIADTTADWDLNLKIILPPELEPDSRVEHFPNIDSPHLNIRYGAVEETEICVDKTHAVYGDFDLRERALFTVQTEKSVTVTYDRDRAVAIADEINTQWQSLRNGG